MQGPRRRPIGGVFGWKGGDCFVLTSDARDSWRPSARHCAAKSVGEGGSEKRVKRMRGVHVVGDFCGADVLWSGLGGRSGSCGSECTQCGVIWCVCVSRGK